MRIVLDAMGSDKYPGPEIEAAIQLARGGGVEIILVGNERVVKPGLDALKATDVNLPIVHAPEMVDMAEKPAAAARGKAENSMAVGMELVKRGEADAFVTAGNTGGALANALFHLGRIRGVKRPGIGAPFPVKGGSCVLIDIGANAECKPEYLLQFAIMGSLYAEKVFGVHRPRVGLLSNGEEAGKGNDLVKGTYPLLASSSLNFIGNVEGKEFFGGQADVVVTDGFTGNIVLKSAEAVAKLLTETIRDEIKSNPITAVGGRLAQPAFKRVRRVLDPSEQGAAPLLGVDGLVFIGHGRSDARALVNAVGTARRAIESGLLAALRAELSSRLNETEAALEPAAAH